MREAISIVIALGLAALGCAAPVGDDAGALDGHGPAGKADGADGPRADLEFCENEVQEVVRGHAEGWWLANAGPDDVDVAPLWDDLVRLGLASGSSEDRIGWEPGGEYNSLAIIPGDEYDGRFLFFILGVERIDPEYAAVEVTVLESLEVEDVVFIHDNDDIFAYCSEANVYEPAEEALGELPAAGAVDVEVTLPGNTVYLGSSDGPEYLVAQAELDLEMVWETVDPAKKAESQLKITVEHGGVEVVLYDASLPGAEGAPDLDRTFDLTEAFYGRDGGGPWTLRITDSSDAERTASLSGATLRTRWIDDRPGANASEPG